MAVTGPPHQTRVRRCNPAPPPRRPACAPTELPETKEVPNVNQEKYTGWHKSTYSGNANSCVEVAHATDGAVGVRDTKQHGRGPVLEFSPDEWQVFVTGIKNGEFAG